MAEYRLGELEMRFAQLIWKNEPIQSGELAKLAEQEFGWKKSTTYTIIKRISDKGIFQNVNGTVSSLVSYDEFRARQSEQIIEEEFAGSFMSFVTAFTSKNKLGKKDIEELQKLIDAAKTKRRK